MDDDVKKGSCLCGGVRFEYRGAFLDFDLCHCSMCRKFCGDPFGAFAGCAKERLKRIRGKELETVFPSSARASRSFCSRCGSSLMYIYHKSPDRVFVSTGLFDGPLGARPGRHVFVQDKCGWFDVADGLPQCGRI